MAKKWGFVSLVVLFAGVLSFAVWVAPLAAQEALKIGVIYGLTGPGSQLQIQLRDGAVLAQEWINKKGGIKIEGKQYKIDLIIEDNQNSAQGSAAAATKLVHRDKLKFIAGTCVPFQTDAVETITQPNKVLLASSKVAYLNPKSTLSFTTTNTLVAPVQGLYDGVLKWYPGVKTVAFSAHDEAGAQAVVKIARNIAKAHGLQLLESYATTFGTKEYYPTWTKILQSKPDVVDIGVGFPEGLAANIRQGRELGFKGPILTPNTGELNTFAALVGKGYATDVVYAGTDTNRADTPANIKMIMTLWQEKYKRAFNVDSLDGFSAIWALTQAIENAQSLDAEKVAKSWQGMTKIETPWGTGRMGGIRAFGLNNLVLPPSPVSQIKDGKIAQDFWYIAEM